MAEMLRLCDKLKLINHAGWVDESGVGTEELAASRIGPRETIKKRPVWGVLNGVY